jgi:hypothetical protein
MKVNVRKRRIAAIVEVASSEYSRSLGPRTVNDRQPKGSADLCHPALRPSWDENYLGLIPSG